MLEPIHNVTFVDDEYKLGSAAARGATLADEQRRVSNFEPATARAVSAYVVSSGARPEDASGGVPANISHLRQSSLAAIRQMAELAKGGHQQREMTAAVEVDLYTAAVISRCWWPPLANSAICRMAARLACRKWLMFAGTPPLASSGRAPDDTT